MSFRYLNKLAQKIFRSITVTEAIMLTKEGKLDNVVIVENKNGTIFLRTTGA